MDSIIVHGAREHNLKNITVKIPRDKFVVITGLSGSGKSSLAFDTIFAEGQRKYVESLSAYARAFLGQLEKPDVDYIEGLSPAISIDQRTIMRNPRSTVGTITEIWDYLRLLFSRVGHAHCPNCGTELTRQGVEEISAKIYQKSKINPGGTAILARIVDSQKGEHKYLLREAKKNHFVKVRVDGTIMDIDEAILLSVDKNKRHTIEIVIEQFLPIELKTIEAKEMIAKAVKKGLNVGKGNVYILINNDKEILFSQLFSCPKCDLSLPEIEPRIFSFNSPAGACPTCQGLGIRLEPDPELILPNPRLTLAEGAIRPWARTTSQNSQHYKILEDLSKKYHFSLDIPVEKLPIRIQKIILDGDCQSNSGKDCFEGVIPNLAKKHRETDSDYLREEIEKYMTEKICPACHGQRLKKEVLSITYHQKNIVELSDLAIDELIEFFTNLKLEDREKEISRQIIKEIINRLNFLIEVGLGYLSLSRTAMTLAGGEIQRIQLATQLGSGLQGVIYILDEPSIGLHVRDHGKLLETLKTLRNLGNTVIVVEHDKETMFAADWIIDMGPGAGEAGGEIMAQGTPKQIIANQKSLTGKYLSGKEEIPVPLKRRLGNGKDIVIKKASAFNLKDITVEIPTGKFVCITGVSGSGKSTLIFNILVKALEKYFYRSKEIPGKHQSITGINNINKVIGIDQSPIGRTPRSNPATYTNLFAPIRELYAAMPEAKAKGFLASHFSFNLKGGRCEACHGEGAIQIEMHFLPDIFITCEECRGTRYNKEALEILYKGKNIAEILEMTVDEALVFFRDILSACDKLKILSAVGLGYMKLGQPATTLSGGEAQRVKLATELSRAETGKTLYILDEPTTGLHFDDIKKLLAVLQALVDRGNTVLVIEHNPEIIKSADWIIDLGPEGGDKGGEVVAFGTPEKVAKVARSYTGQFLKKIL